MTTTISIPTIETERLRLRSPKPSDLDAYIAYRASARSRFVGGPNTADEAFSMLCSIVGQWQLRGYGRWMVAQKDTDDPLGVVGIYHPLEWPEPEIGWTVFEHAEGKGVAYEAALATRDFAYRTLGWKTIVSLVADENQRSVALARRMGCKRENVFQHSEFGDLPVWRHPGAEEGRP
ncbi:MAG: GNAT family N-acetyltransferase [Pseudomonadota bacterium]